MLTSLVHVTFELNRLSYLPTTIGRLTALLDLRLWSNQLSGTLPVELGNMTALVTFQCFQNKLFGTIPSEIFQLSNLSYFHAQDNFLTGEPPSLPSVHQVNCNLANNCLVSASAFEKIVYAWILLTRFQECPAKGSCYCANQMIPCPTTPPNSLTLPTVLETATAMRNNTNVTSAVVGTPSISLSSAVDVDSSARSADTSSGVIVAAVCGAAVFVVAIVVVSVFLVKRCRNQPPRTLPERQSASSYGDVRDVRMSSLADSNSTYEDASSALRF
jgi:hypothetical protein